MHACRRPKRTATPRCGSIDTATADIDASATTTNPGRSRVELRVKRLHPDARLPVRAYPGDAAFDLHALEDLTIVPQQRAVVPTGIAIALPAGVAALTVPRSGLAARHGITIVNAPGLIDPGYRGELMIILLNTDPELPFAIHAGDRIAQLLLVALPDIELVEVDELDDTARGARGFGSSGTTADGGHGPTDPATP